MVTVLGSINLDLIGGVERLPRPGETVPGSTFATAPGGKGANQALAAARAGAAVRMIGAVGRDSFAGEALALLRDGGIELTRVREVEEPTGVALILVDPAGENVIAVMPGANGTIAEEHANELDFRPGDVLLLQLEIPVAASAAAARRAREADALVLLSFAPFRADALGLLEHATHLIVNESECALIGQALGLAGGDTGAEAAAVAARLGSSVIATLGADGLLAAAGDSVMRIPALPVRAVDTVGAGDTFCGYFAAALAEEAPLQDALRLAASAASLACTRPGAQPAIPMRSEVETALLAR